MPPSRASTISSASWLSHGVEQPWGHMRLSIQLGLDNLLESRLSRPSNPIYAGVSRQPLMSNLIGGTGEVLMFYRPHQKAIA